VVDSGSLSGAAAGLGVTQPTLSHQLSALETHLQRQLLIRGANGVTVTDAGRVFYRHAQLLARQLQQAEAEVRDAEDRGGGNVSLGLATCGAASTLALPILQEILSAHPHLRLRMHDNFAGTLSEAIMNGRLDLALVYGAGPSRGVRFQRLFLEELFLLVPAGLPMARVGGRAVILAEQRGLPMILPSEVHFLRPVIERACAKAGFRPQVVAEIDSLAELREALRQGLGAAILPHAAVDGVPGLDGLRVIPIGPDRLEATVSLCTSAQLPITAAIETLQGAILRLVEARLASGAWRGTRRASEAAAAGR
jgi:LysR family nitrogen assimilation transcriptional regulator